MKAALCTRRAGKSYGVGLYLFKEAYENPGVSCLYIALTRDSAKKIMWQDILKRIAKDNSIECRYNETELMITLSNESTINLAGADSGPDEMEKFLGRKYKLVVVDEAGSFRQDLHRLIYQIIRPATVDLNGTIVLIGTPTNFNQGLYYDVTIGLEAGWSLHKWSAFDNPFISAQWKEEIDKITNMSPQIIDTPLYKQMYQGEWFTDTSKLVYKFDPTRNIYDTLPNQNYYHVLGIDLGYEDDSAFTVCSYADHDTTLYVQESSKKSHMILYDVAMEIKRLQSKYDIHKILVDNSAKQAVEEMRIRYGICFEAADKTGKSDFIEICNSDLIRGNVKFQRENTKQLQNEMTNLIWDDRSKKKQEHPNCANHCTDSFLYPWRYCYQYAATHKQLPKNKYGEDYMIEKLEEEARMRKEYNDGIMPIWQRENII